MEDKKYDKVRLKVENTIPAYKIYMTLNNDITKIDNSNVDEHMIQSKLEELKKVAYGIKLQVKHIMYEKGLELDVDDSNYDIEKEIGIMATFTLDETYFDNENLPDEINERLKDEYYDDCFNGYLMLLNLAKKGYMDPKNIYKILFDSFTHLYDLLGETYKANGINGSVKYFKILELFKKTYDTSISGIINNEKYDNYIIKLTSNDNILNELKTFDLYSILLCFNNEEFLSAFENDDNILNDIASIIIRRKKDGLTKENEIKQLRTLSKNLGSIPKRKDTTINL